MVTRWNKYCAGLAAFALVGCSTYRDFEDWWTEDLRGPRNEELADADWSIEEGAVDEQGRPIVPPRSAVARRRAQSGVVVYGNESLTSGVSPGKPVVEARLPPITTPTVNPEVPLVVPRQEHERSAPAAPSRARVAALPPVVAPIPESPAPLAAPAAMVPIVPASVASVAGMSEARVRELFGAPTTMTERAPQKTWRYAGEGCSVEVVFFLDVTRNTYAALAHKTLAADKSASTVPCARPVELHDPRG